MSFGGYEAVRATAGLIESKRGLLQVSGGDRAAWLQGLLTNDVAALAVGQGCYAAWLTPQGRMITDVGVLALDGALILELPAALASALRDRLDMYVITEDVTVDDLTDVTTKVSVHGPTSAGVVGAWAAAAFGEDERSMLGRLAELPEWWHLRIDPAGAARAADGGVVGAVGALADGSALVVGSRALGVVGFDVHVNATLRAAIREAFVRSGAVPVEASAAEALRVEAGRPLFGVDMDEDTIPLETGAEERMISFTKGCYVGQEVIVRVRDRGHGRVARRLVGLVSSEPSRDGAGTLAPGATLWNADREVGRLTSVAFSPLLDRGVALGYVHRDFLAPGTRLEADDAGTRKTLEVTLLPLVAPR
jgi:folate-binding protein YgfZ